MPVAASEPKVAIVHDWLVGGGAELVVLELHRMYPDAPIYTSYATDEWRKKLDNKVITGWLQHFGKLRKFLTLGRIWWFTHLDLSAYDIVISSSGNGEAKSVKTPSTVAHICYCHAPTHYYWRHYDRYLAEPGFGAFNPLVRIALRMLVGPLRRWDKKYASTRPDVYIANSTHTAAEIKTFYNRESTIVTPPVDMTRFTAATQGKRHGYVTVQRQVPYKRIDLLIQACNELHADLLVVGRGPEHENLKKIAGPTITFRSDVTDAEMPSVIASHEAFLFAAHEDFGITPVEALATGTPVIAYKKGGAVDYVIPGKTGEFFTEQSVVSIIRALQAFSPRTYDAKSIAQFADKFSTEAFHANMHKIIDSYLPR